MRTLTYLILLLVASINITQAAEIPAGKEVIQFESKRGTVTFLHKMHAGINRVECTTCHHKFEFEGQPQSCSSCHQSRSDGKTPLAIKAFHNRCRGCHQYTIESGKPAGPVKKCNLCHIRPAKKTDTKNNK